MIELEIVGGASAAYLSRFSKRRFATMKDAGTYMRRIFAITEDLGVSKAHQMSCYSNGQDVTAECWDAGEGK